MSNNELINAAERLIDQQRYNDAVALITFESNLKPVEAQQILAELFARQARR